MLAESSASTPSGTDSNSSLKRPRPDDHSAGDERPTSKPKFDTPVQPPPPTGMSQEERTAIMREVQARWTDVAFYTEAIKIGMEAMGHGLNQVWHHSLFPPPPFLPRLILSRVPISNSISRHCLPTPCLDSETSRVHGRSR